MCLILIDFLCLLFNFYWHIKQKVVKAKTLDRVYGRIPKQMNNPTSREPGFQYFGCI